MTVVTGLIVSPWSERIYKYSEWSNPPRRKHIRVKQIEVCIDVYSRSVWAGRYENGSRFPTGFDICPSRGQLGASFTKGATRDTPLPPSSRHQSWEHHFGRVVDFLCFPQDFSFRPSTCSEEDTSFGDHISISNHANHLCELINFYTWNIIISQETTDGWVAQLYARKVRATGVAFLCGFDRFKRGNRKRTVPRSVQP